MSVNDYIQKTLRNSNLLSSMFLFFSIIICSLIICSIPLKNQEKLFRYSTAEITEQIIDTGNRLIETMYYSLFYISSEDDIEKIASHFIKNNEDISSIVLQYNDGRFSLLQKDGENNISYIRQKNKDSALYNDGGAMIYPAMRSYIPEKKEVFLGEWVCHAETRERCISFNKRVFDASGISVPVKFISISMTPSFLVKKQQYLLDKHSIFMSAHGVHGGELTPSAIMKDNIHLYIKDKQDVDKVSFDFIYVLPTTPVFYTLFFMAISVLISLYVAYLFEKKHLSKISHQLSLISHGLDNGCQEQNIHALSDIADIWKKIYSLTEHNNRRISRMLGAFSLHKSESGTEVLNGIDAGKCVFIDIISPYNEFSCSHSKSKEQFIMDSLMSITDNECQVKKIDGLYVFSFRKYSQTELFIQKSHAPSFLQTCSKDNFWFNMVTIKKVENIFSVYPLIKMVLFMCRKQRGFDVIDFSDELRCKMQMCQEFINNVLNHSHEHGQIVFQSIRNFKTGDIKSYESLARWGAFSPDSFIPVAEESGLIQSLGKILIDKTLNIFSSFPLLLSNSDISININVSVIQLEDCFFSIFLDEMLNKYNINPQRLCIELTESHSDGKHEVILSNIADLRKLGCKLAIDDFGRSASNFDRVITIKPDFLKIDKVYTTEGFLNDNKMILSIINGIIEFAENNNITLIFEGVETSEMAARICESGGCYMQGYLFEKPSKMEDVIPNEYK